MSLTPFWLIWPEFWMPGSWMKDYLSRIVSLTGLKGSPRTMFTRGMICAIPSRPGWIIGGPKGSFSWV